MKMKVSKNVYLHYIAGYKTVCKCLNFFMHFLIFFLFKTNAYGTARMFLCPLFHDLLHFSAGFNF